MKRLQLTIATLLTVSSATYAQSETSRLALDLIGSGLDRRLSARLAEPGALDRIVRNANECAPDRAEPVWGAEAALLGYACTHNENGS